MGLRPSTGNIVTYLHQTDLSKATPSGVLGKINAHEMYMKITPDTEPPSKKKDIALKATSSKEKKSITKKIIVVDNKEDDEQEEDDSDEEVALLVRKVTRALGRLDKKGIKYSSSKKKFFLTKKKLEEMPRRYRYCLANKAFQPDFTIEQDARRVEEKYISTNLQEQGRYSKLH